MTCGIYSIRATNHIYIGKSVNIEKRWHRHSWLLSHGKHLNKFLQAIVGKYGSDSLAFDVLQECESEQLNSLEVEWIKRYRSSETLEVINMTNGGTGGAPNFYSEETRRKMSESHKGRPATRGRTGQPHSEETRKKISDSNRDKPKTAEHKAKLAEAVRQYAMTHPNPRQGAVVSEETRQKIKDALRYRRERGL